MDKLRKVCVAGVALVAIVATTMSVSSARPKAKATPINTAAYEPVLDPANFVSKINNRYLPFPVGRVMVLEGVKDGVTQTETVTVTSKKRVIEGITATVVHDVAKHGSTLLEKTSDWYAQDKQGNVWYLGEATVAYEGGKKDRTGSWQAGVNDAEPGIVMLAHPAILDTYRQELLRGKAEDTAWVVHVGGTLKLPLRTVHNILATLEATRVEPGSYDKKVYAPGIGIVAEQSLTSVEWARLVSVKG